MARASSSADDSSSTAEIVDVVLYLFVLGPAVEWCLKSPRVNRGRPGSRSGIALAVCLLATIAGGKLAFELAGRDPNHFQVLGVRVDATHAEIKRAYKADSLKYHPDKNPDDPKAHTKFMNMQRAYEVLKDPTQRDVYNKFGKSGLDDQSGSSTSLTNIAVFYVIWIVIGYLLTMGKASEDARTWAFSGLLALAVFEYQTRILSSDFLAPIFPHSTVNEKLELLHRLFPPFLHGSRMISQVIFRDLGLYNKLLLEQMHLKVDELGKQVHATRLEFDSRQTGASSGGTAAADTALAPSAAAAPNANSMAEAVQQAEETWKSLLQQQPALQPSTDSANESSAEAPAATSPAAAASQVTQQANQTRLMNIVWFFVIYAFFKYLVDKD
mmetsp:Transcript_46168/g.76331  ORF Transcript_46168/g.76331 Transcript_46168/m.76331 type:complete len:384 (-) Transcript_46168:139-1290(-)